MSKFQENVFFSVLLIASGVVFALARTGIWMPDAKWVSILAAIIGAGSLLLLILQGAWKFIAGLTLISGSIVGFYVIPLWAKILLGIIGTVVGFGALIFYYLAPKNRWFTFAKEGTAKVIVRGDKVEDIIMQWEGHTFDPDGNVIPTGEWTKNGRVLKAFDEVKDQILIKPNELSQQIDHFSRDKAELLVESLKNIGIRYLQGLQEAAEDGQIQREISGFGPMTEEGVLELIDDKRGKLFEPKFKTVKQDGSEASSPSDADKVIIVYEQVDRNADDVVPPQSEDSHWLGGLRFYSWMHPLADVYIYEFTWSGVSSDGTVKEHSEEVLDYIMLKGDLYYFKVTNAEDKDNMPLIAEIVSAMRVINPRKALFEIDDWLEMITNRSRPAVRDALTTDSYEELISDPQDLGDDIFATIVGRGLIREFEQDYGIRVKGMEIANLDPVEEFREATLQPKLAEYERQATETKAKGEAAARDINYDVIEDHPQGAEIRAAEALEESEARVFGGGLTEMINKLLGN